MKDLYQVIRRPVVTEKSTAMKAERNQILFEVAKDSNKVEIKKAIETVFKVKVIQVRTMRVEGKQRKVGKTTGKRPDWKKAIVTLGEGDTIDFFEGT